MDICQREGLHQVDLLSPAADKITQQEYHAQRRGQLNLDIANMELLGDGITPMHTTFETNKEKIRNAISDIAERATSFEEFQRLLKAEYGILVKDHRGRFSYLPADRQKFISARALGSNYDRDRLLRIFAENARNKERNNPHWAADDPMAILFIKSDLRLVVDLQTCVKAQQSRAYAQKVKISNLQQMARTVAYVQEHGYDSYEKLSDTTDAIQSKMAKARSDAKFTEAKLKKVNEQIRYLGQYLSTKSVYIQNHVVQPLQGALAVQEVELAYKLPDAYFHIQTCDDGFDYTLYNKDFTERDGGILETDGDKPVQEAMTELLAEFGCDAAEGRVMDAAELREQADTVAEQQAEVLKEKLAAERPAPEETLSFYVAECLEFTFAGEFHDHLTMEEALEVYECFFTRPKA